MSDTLTIPIRTINKIERTLNEIQIKLRREELESTVDEKTMMQFMGYENYRSAAEARKDGRIPENAWIELTNGKRRYFLHKLIKSKTNE